MLDVQDDDSKYIVPPAGKADSHLPDLYDFARRNNLQIGSTVTGIHNRGSKHYTGNAFDIKDSGTFSDEQVSALSEAARLAGFKLRDERKRPSGQAVWDGPHIHVEYVGGGDPDAKYFTVASPSQQLPATQGIAPPPAIVPATAPATTPTVTSTIRDDSGNELPTSNITKVPRLTSGEPVTSPSVGMQITVPIHPDDTAQDIYESAYTRALLSMGFKADEAQTLGLQMAKAQAIKTNGQLFKAGTNIPLSDSELSDLKAIGATPFSFDDPEFVAQLKAAAESNKPFAQRAAQAVISAANMGTPDTKFMAGAVIKAGAGLAEAGGGALRIGLTPNLIGQMAGLRDPFAPAEQAIERQAAGARTGVTETSGYDPITEGAQNLTAGAIETAPLALTTAGTGIIPAAASFGTYGALQSAGQGAPLSTVAKEGGKQALIGGLLGAEGADIHPVIRTGATTLGAFGVEKASGTPTGQALQSAATTGLLRTIGEVKEYVHADFGKVTESENQSGVPRGKLRVTDTSGNDHVIIKPSTVRNQRAVPVSQPAEAELRPSQPATVPAETQPSIPASQGAASVAPPPDHPVAASIVQGEVNAADILDTPLAHTVMEDLNEAREITAQPANTSSESNPRMAQPDTSGERAATEKGLIAPPDVSRETVTSDAPPTTTGIAQRVEQARRGESPPTGQGISSADSVVRGRELLQAGADPQAAVDKFQSDGAISSDAMALVRARHEELARTANKAFDDYGIDSPEFKAAEKARSDWWESAVKPMQTEWSKTGMAQQGETAIDTGTFYGLYRAVKDATGKELTPDQAEQARGIATRVASADSKVADTTRLLTDELNKATGITDLHPDVRDAIQRFVDQAQANQPSARTQTRQQARKSLDDEAAIIKSNIAAEFARLKAQSASGQFKSQGGLGALDPDGIITKNIVKLAKNRVKAGVTDAAQLINDIHAAVKDLADITKRQVAEVLTGLGNAPGIKRPPSDWMNVKGTVRDQLKAEDAAQGLTDLRARLAAGGDLTHADAKAVWQYARDNYVDKGVDVAQAFQSTAKDLGVTPDDVRRAVASQPKTKRLTDDMYQQMSARRQARQSAESWVQNQGKSLGLRAVENTANAFFNLKTFGHGTVGPVTHAGENVFHPSRWVDYFTNMGRTYKAAYSSAAHERYIQDLVNDPNYIIARRAGLANEPGKFYDEYQNNLAQKMFGAVGKIGNRGFDVLKRMRQDFFNARWNKLDPSQQTPEMAKEIADLANHSTGAIRTSLPFPGLSRGVFFAAPLEASRWARTLGDPIKAANTLINWKNASPSEKYFAKAVGKNHAEFAATYLAALALNQGVLVATGSKDRVNFADPSKGDWLRLKAKGRAVEPTGGIIATLDFLGKLGQAAFGAQDPREGRWERMGKAGAQYGRGKLSPIASTATDFLTQGDYRNRPMPFSSDKERKGKPRYSWAEYFLTQQSPIPAAEGLHDFFATMREQGVPVSTMDQIFNAAMTHKAAIAKGAAIGAVSGSTGVRIGEEYAPRPVGIRPPPLKSAPKSPQP